MQPIFGETQRRLLKAIFERAAENASTALSQWLGKPVSLSISAVDEVELAEAVSSLGPEDLLVAACSMDMVSRLGGELLLVFEDRSGLALTDMILGQPAGKAMDWGEVEQSAALETANIVGCAFLNSLGMHLPDTGTSPLIPSPPTFRREFVGSLLQFALMDQAMEADRVLLVRSRFAGESGDLNWWLLFVPRGSALTELSEAMQFGHASPPGTS